METQQERSDNELIAEFMGLKRQLGNWRQMVKPPVCFKVGKLWVEENQLEYATSWDWLIPVVEKMFNLRTPSGEENFQKSLNLRLHAFRRKNEIHYPIQHVYKNVVIFIKWYNEAKKSES